MAHQIDGFELEFTGRTSWKAARSQHGQLIDIVPVTWREGFQKRADDNYLQVWYRNAGEMERARLNSQPFVVAVAEPWPKADISDEAPRFRHFNAVFEVIATGKKIDNLSIETRVLRRLRV